MGCGASAAPKKYEEGEQKAPAPEAKPAPVAAATPAAVKQEKAAEDKVEEGRGDIKFEAATVVEPEYAWLDEPEEGEEEEEDDDDEDDDFVEFDFSKLSKARSSVSAEKAKKISQEDKDTVKTYDKSDDQKERIRKAMSKSFIFDALSAKEKEKVVLSLKEVKMGPGETVIQQGAMVGSDDNGLFVLESGNLKVFKKFPNEDEPKHVHTYTNPGDTFGELALLYNCPRAATVETDGDCTLWALERNGFAILVQGALQERRDRTDDLLQSVDFLKDLSKGDRGKITDVVQYRAFSAGEEIFKEGDEGHELYIVEEGTLEAKINGETVMSYAAESFFGELALLGGSGLRKATVVCVTEGQLISIDRASFKRLLGKAEKFLKERAEAVYGKQATQDLEATA
jgi:cAMP-dependent protein kinase regulator